MPRTHTPPSAAATQPASAQNLPFDIPVHHGPGADPTARVGASNGRVPHGTPSPIQVAGDTPARTALAGWNDQLRLPLSWSLQTLMLLLHAGEEWQRAQLDSWHLALRHHEQAHQKLLSCEDAAGMASLHADLMRFDTANFTHLSQRCLDTGVHLNTNLARLIAQTLDGSRSQLMRSAFESLQAGMRTGIGPLDEIFNSSVLRELSLRGSADRSAAAIPQKP